MARNRVLLFWGLLLSAMWFGNFIVSVFALIDGSRVHPATLVASTLGAFLGWLIVGAREMVRR